MPSMDTEFLDFGFQYYVAARCGVRANLSPVTGNLFHHAVEMFLKARISQSMSSDDMKKKFGHGLKLLWQAFKAEFPSVNLGRFDALVDALDRFESIRYPDEIVAKGAQLVIALDRNAATSTRQLSGTPVPRYEIVLADLDELIAEVLRVSSRNPAFFTNGLNQYAREAMKYENPGANFFLPNPA
jgi:hypothetical protein